MVRRLETWCAGAGRQRNHKASAAARRLGLALAVPGPELSGSADCYLALWHSTFEADFTRWTATHSQRRWMPTEGQEWSWISKSGSITAAMHLLRLFGGGLRGPAGKRMWQQRTQAQDKCHACGNAPTAVRWRTAASEHDALGWCAGCLPDPVAIAT